MKALCWHGKNDVRVDTVSDPKIQEPTDAIIKITSTAICGSDLHLYDGFMLGMEKGDVLGHEPQKDQPVAHGQRIRIGKIELVLAAAALLVEGIHAPAQFGHVLHHRVEETDRLQRLIDVVGRTHALIMAVDDSLVGAVRFPQNVELGFNADVENVCLGFFQRALQRDSGAVWIGFAAVVEITGEPGEALVPR